MFQQPKRAKRLYFDVIPKNTDEYVTFRSKLATEELKEKIENPIWHLHKGYAPTDDVPLTFGLLMNLASVCHAEDTQVLWGYIQRYAPNASPQANPFLKRLAEHAVCYYRDFIRPNKIYRTPNSIERAALEDLAHNLTSFNSNSSAEEIQSVVYEIGKRHPFENLRDWFKALYQILLGQNQGPRFGSFIVLYGIPESIILIERALNGEDLTLEKPN